MAHSNKDYREVNRDLWNKRVEVHYNSAFYDNDSFIEGRSSLNSIELDILGDISGKSVLHLQCHFGQDSISMDRMGAEVTGVDLSDASIKKAVELNEMTNASCRFVCCDVYDSPKFIEQKFDVVFASYGTIGWLPDIDKWAYVVSHFLKEGGRLVFAEFHPVVWMFDDNFERVAYNYFNDETIEETSVNTYTDGDTIPQSESLSWNHGMADVVMALLKNDMQLLQLKEFDYSPYDCLNGMVEEEKGKFRIKKMGNKMPLVYAIEALKN